MIATRQDVTCADGFGQLGFHLIAGFGSRIVKSQGLALSLVPLPQDRGGPAGGVRPRSAV